MTGSGIGAERQRRRRRRRRETSTQSRDQHAQSGSGRRHAGRDRRVEGGLRPPSGPLSIGAAGFWQPAGTWAPVAGAACVVGVVYGLVFRQDVWEARTFVLLFYGALVSGVLANVAWWLVRRNGLVLPNGVRDLRGLLDFLLAFAVFWVFFPSLSRPLMGWFVRVVGGLRFY